LGPANGSPASDREAFDGPGLQGRRACDGRLTRSAPLHAAVDRGDQLVQTTDTGTSKALLDVPW
jgi:hypothetical protein